MQLSKKVLAIIIVLAIILTAVAMAAIFVPSVNAWFSVNTGSWGVTALAIAQAPLQYALSGGAQTALFWGVITAGLFGFAYWVWHWDIGFKLSGATKPSSPASNYDNNMAREPTEPERGSTNVSK